MEADASLKLKTLKVDGGACKNNFLMRFQADILGTTVERPKITETTALGAAYLAGLAVGFYTKASLKKIWQLDQNFKSKMPKAKREQLYENWKKAVIRTIVK
jgi:glycerol kinase